VSDAFDKVKTLLGKEGENLEDQTRAGEGPPSEKAVKIGTKGDSWVHEEILEL